VGFHVTGDSAAALDFIDDRVIDFTKKRNIPGTTVAVTYKGRLVYNKAFGFANVEKGIKMMPHHRTQIGSVSKVLTAAGIFKCIQLGLLNLTNRITEPQLLGQQWFLDAFQMGIDANIHGNASWNHLNAITLEHLMNHTSGYARSADGVKAAELFNNGVYATSSYTNAIKWFMARQPFVTNAPGLLESYSNHGPGQLGLIIQIVTGMSYEAFMQQFVLQPHGINNMRIGKPQFLQQNQQLDARRYHWYDGGAPYAENPFHGQLAPVTYDATTEHPGAQGSWTGTARDLARFMVATDKLNNHSDILPPNLLTIMESNAMSSVTGFAKGWARNATSGRLAHNGNIGYGASSIQKNTNGVNIAVTCNTGESAFCDALVSGIFSDLTTNVLSDIPQFFDLFGGELQLQANN
jgi:CubicO group peptidase (beta-lactamase class C family)